MEDYVHKCNGRPFSEKKQCKIINITVAKSTGNVENVYHVTRQN